MLAQLVGGRILLIKFVFGKSARCPYVIRVYRGVHQTPMCVLHYDRSPECYKDNSKSRQKLEWNIVFRRAFSSSEGALGIWLTLRHRYIRMCTYKTHTLFSIHYSPLSWCSRVRWCNISCASGFQPGGRRREILGLPKIMNKFECTIVWNVE